MNKKDEIDKIIKESFEKARQLDLRSFWMMAKVTWIILVLAFVFYKDILGIFVK